MSGDTAVPSAPSGQVTKFAYGVDDRPGVARGLAFGAQHVIVLFTALISEPLIISAQLELDAGQTQFLVSGTMLGAGIGAFLQTRRIGFVGASLPLAMGSFLLFVGPILATARAAGLAAAFTGLILAALVQWLVFSWVVARVSRWFPPLVVGIVVTIIGLYLLPIGAEFVVNAGEPTAGEAWTFLLAGLTILLITVFNRFGKGFMKLASLLIALAIAYVVAAIFGYADFDRVAAADWVAFPEPMPFGGPEWPGTTAFLILLFTFLITAVDVIGVTVAVTGMLGLTATRERFRGAIAADGLASAASGVFAGSPLITYSQNIGVLQVTGVATRHAVAWGGGLLAVMAFCPKLIQVLAAIPRPVFGAALVVAWGLVVATGTQIVRDALHSDREVFIYAISIGVGMAGVFMPDEVVAKLPQAPSLFLASGPTLGILLAVVLNLLLPGRLPDRPDLTLEDDAVGQARIEG